MGRFMKAYRFNLLYTLSKFEGSEVSKKLVTSTLKQDLLVWKTFAMEAVTGLPFYALPEAPLLSPLRLILDAAGAAYRWEFSGKRNLSVPGDRGAASVGYYKAGPVFLATIKWPDRLLTVANGKNGASDFNKIL
jgi:hypothetical protein